jgi:hypothetical protein
MPSMFGGLFGDEDEPAGHPTGIAVERGSLREDKIFVDHGEQRLIGEHLQNAYNALNEALAIHRDLDRADTEYCDEGDVAELDSSTLDALGAVERAWQALCVVTGAHEVQLAAADEVGPVGNDSDDTSDHAAD